MALFGKNNFNDLFSQNNIAYIVIKNSIDGSIIDLEYSILGIFEYYPIKYENNTQYKIIGPYNLHQKKCYNDPSPIHHIFPSLQPTNKINPSINNHDVYYS